MFENRVLRRMCGTKREDVTGGRRMLLGVEVCILYFVILPQTKEDWLCWNVAHR